MKPVLPAVSATPASSPAATGRRYIRIFLECVGLVARPVFKTGLRAQCVRGGSIPPHSAVMAVSYRFQQLAKTEAGAGAATRGSIAVWRRRDPAKLEPSLSRSSGVGAKSS